MKSMDQRTDPDGRHYPEGDIRRQNALMDYWSRAHPRHVDDTMPREHQLEHDWL